MGILTVQLVQLLCCLCCHIEVEGDSSGLSKGERGEYCRDVGEKNFADKIRIEDSSPQFRHQLANIYVANVEYRGISLDTEWLWGRFVGISGEHKVMTLAIFIGYPML
jgi:hypothetical protein